MSIETTISDLLENTGELRKDADDIKAELSEMRRVLKPLISRHGTDEQKRRYSELFPTRSKSENGKAPAGKEPAGKK